MFQALGFVIRYLPLVLGAVTFVQNFADSKASREARKALAVSFVVDTLQKFGVVANDRTISVIELLVDLTVTAFNKFGIFTSSEGPAPEAVKIASEVAVATRVELKDAVNVRLDDLESALLR
jgi:hypothetical protein